MQLTLMSLNLRYGGLYDADRRPDDRWPGLAGIIGEVRPDIVLLQECNGWNQQDYAQLARAEHDLRMRGLLAEVASGAHLAVLYRPDLVRWSRWDSQHSRAMHHGYGSAVFQVYGFEHPLTVVTTHLNPYSATAAAEEARLLVWRAVRHGELAIIGGDINHIPLGDTEPDWDAMPPKVRASRTAVGGWPTLADRSVGDVFSVAGMTDVASYLSVVHQDESLLDATTSMGARLDQFHVTAPLVPALAEYRRVDTHSLSDHHGIVMTIDTAEIDSEPPDEQARLSLPAPRAEDNGQPRPTDAEA